MEQARLWYEFPEDALGDLIKALGGPKAVGHRLMPDIAMDDARRQVDGWLDRNSKYKPSLSQLMWLLAEGRRVGCHVLIEFFADAAGYAKPTPVEPKDADAELQREFIESVKKQERILEEMKRHRMRMLQGAA